MALLVGATAPVLQRLAVPAVCLLITFLGYGSQYLFANAPDLDPGPPTRRETVGFNALLLCLWWTYYKAVTVDPGRYEFPATLRKQAAAAAGSDGEGPAGSSSSRRRGTRASAQRWCKKCALPKPPRAHHCKVCRRCVPKMDHHCPWTANCVSLQTFPHFVRFLAYANASLWALLALLGQRFGGVWRARHAPAYLGPTPPQLALLTALGLAAGLAALLLGVMLAAVVRGWALNTTMIEGWEIERHEAVLERRAGGEPAWWRSGEGSDGDDDDMRRATEPVEFPYDVGVFANMAQAMGTGNPLLWLLPFAGAPRVAKPAANPAVDGSPRARGPHGLPAGVGWEYEENGLNDHEGMWPPPDPDKVRHARMWRRRRAEQLEAEARERDHGYGYDGFFGVGGAARQQLTPAQEKEAFRARQERDLRRWQGARARILDELEEVRDDGDDYDYDYADDDDEGGGSGGGYGHPPTMTTRAGGGGGGGGIVLDEGKSGWVNADGERLGDYGVDEDAEFDDPATAAAVAGGRDGDGGGSGSGSGWERRRRGDDADVADDEEVPLAELIRRRKVRTRDDGDEDVFR
ncbi:DHHC palmitoyltransferase-domain-containing protein [Xylariaceae sp. FL0804]|nr:DHHC palmitoyltransferase-domain-containing protein [Xylariaceae sp. FL0804]